MGLAVLLVDTQGRNVTNFESIAGYIIPPIACFIIGVALGGSLAFSKGYEAGIRHAGEMSK